MKHEINSTHRAAILKRVQSRLSDCGNDLAQLHDYDSEVRQLIMITDQVHGDYCFEQQLINQRYEEIRFLQDRSKK